MQKLRNFSGKLVEFTSGRGRTIILKVEHVHLHVVSTQDSHLIRII
jgi:hypothetical protein